MPEIDFSSLPDDRPLQSLPWRATAGGVLARFLTLAPLTARLALVPALVSFALGPVLLFLGAADLLLLVASVANLYLLIWFAAAVQRLVLCGPSESTTRVLPRWGEVELRFLGRFIGLGAIMMLVAFPATFIFGSFAGAFTGAQPQFGLWMLAPALIAGAAALGGAFALPAATLGRGYGYARAWRESKGVLTTLIGLFVVLVVPIDVTAMLLDWLFLEIQLATDLMIPRLAMAVVANYLSVTLASVLLAEVFARRTGWTAPPASAT